jgi:hypothetical protein
MSEEEIPEEGGEEPVVAEETQLADPPEAEVEATGEQVAEQPQDVWSNFRQMEQFQGKEDSAIAQSLYEAMQREDAANRALQQYQTVVPIAQEYLQNREQFEAWKSSQFKGQQPAQPANAAPQAPQPEEKPWWNPPEIKDSHKRYLVKDENGRDTIHPDAPLDAKASLEDYMNFRADFAQKFLDNPEQALGPMVEKVAVERAESIIESRLGRMQDEQYVSGLEAENKDWLYDEKGNVSAEGMAVQKYIADAKGNGIQGAEARWDYATKMVERDLLLQAVNQMQQGQQPAAPQQVTQQAPQQAQPTADQKNMEYLRQQAARTPSQRSSTSSNATAQDTTGMTFAEKLQAVAQEQGYL